MILNGCSIITDFCNVSLRDLIGIYDPDKFGASSYLTSDE